MRRDQDQVWRCLEHCHARGLVGVEGKVELQDDLRAILRGDEPPGGDSDASAGDALVAGGTSKPATYVNQWKFRSVYGRTFLLNFFFNGGSLSGDELLRQLTHQVHGGVELAGAKVLGVCLDAGGGNSRLCSLLRGGQKVGDAAWVSAELVTFASPACPSRSVAVFFCATHGLKSQRNAFSNSSVTPGAKKRTFVTTEGVAFGLESIERCLVRDQKRSARKTKLTPAAVQPNKWEKMRVALAKAVFDPDTRDENIFYIGSELGCLDELRSSGEGGGEVQGQALARRRIEALKVKLAAAAERLGERLGDANFQQLRQDLAHVEYNFHVGTIFIENFLNGEVSVTPDNIDEKEKETRSALEYFEAWRLASLQLKQQGNPAWERSFISTTTYKNLRIGVCGFFQYCRLVFLLPNPPSYVKFLPCQPVIA